MSDYFDPYDADRPLRLTCSCGLHDSDADHAAAALRQRSDSAEFEAYSNEFIEATLMKALFPQDAVRRVAGGQRFITAPVAELLAAALGSGQGEAPLDELLSHRELQVFERLAMGHSVG